MANTWQVVLFKENKRLGKNVPDAAVGLAVVQALKERGVESRLISKKRAFGPKGEDPDDGRLWCPYCRRWTEFVVPYGDDVLGATAVESLQVYYEMCNRSDIRVCLWCTVSTQEYYVKFFNPDLWHVGSTRRKPKRKRG